MKQTAIVLVTDKGFLVPSLVVALQVLEQPAVTAMADVLVVLVDIEVSRIDSIREELHGKDLHLIRMDSSRYLPPDSTFFNQTHVPRTTLSRLALHEVVPAQYENIVYLDGDIQITGDIAPLVRHRVKDGYIAAAADGNWTCEGDAGSYWKQHTSYLDGLGIREPRDYFNAGVLAFRMKTWRDKAPRALDYFTRNAERCLYHDQSALNAVFHGCVEPLSPLFNYVSFYADLEISDEVKPKIVHFTGRNKPWNHIGPPWNGRFVGIYRQFLDRYPQFANDLDLNRQETPKSVSSVSELLKSKVLRPWRQVKRRGRLRNYLRSGKFAVKA